MPIENNNSINGFESNLRSILCGVPQGSSLGPLLFLIYINDFKLCLDKTETGHFADDTYMFGSKKLATIEAVVNHEVKPDDTFIMFGSKKVATIETVIDHEVKLVTKWLRLNKYHLMLVN